MAYQLSDVASRVQTRVRDSGYSTTTIKGFIQDAQRDVFNEYDLRFMEKTQNYTLTTNVQDITNGSGLPSDYIRAISLRVTTDNYEKVIPFVDYKDLDEVYPDQGDDTAGAPQYWWMFGSTISVYPKPDQAYTLQLRYLKRPADISADADVPDIPKEFEELLIYGAGYRVFEDKDMDDKAAVFEQKYQREVQKLVSRYASRQTQQQQTIKLPRRRRRATSFFG